MASQTRSSYLTDSCGLLPIHHPRLWSFNHAKALFWRVTYKLSGLAWKRWRVRYSSTKGKALSERSDLKKAGLKVTLPRLRVLQTLEDAEPGHLSAEEIYRRLLMEGETIGHATVYRVLVQLEQAKIVNRHNFDGGHAVYELASSEHHDHMVNVDTGEVIEFYNERIEQIQEEIAQQHGVEIVDHQLVLFVRVASTPD